MKILEAEPVQSLVYFRQCQFVLTLSEFDIFNNQSTNIMVTMTVMPDPLSKQIRPRGSEFFLARKLWPFHPLSILAVFDES